MLGDALLEVGQRGLGLFFQADGDENVEPQPQSLGVGQGHIALDHAFVFQRLHPYQAGRWRKVHPPRQLHVAERSVFLQLGQYADINRI
ncbi:hypothetical protein D9M68_843900 [compost metagenome]